MIGSYQEERREQPRKTTKSNFATVRGVSSAGLTLQFDGETQAGQKKYKYNKSVQFAVGNRVYVVPVEDTYLVLCIV